jgi:hypothetical protein
MSVVAGLSMSGRLAEAEARAKPFESGECSRMFVVTGRNRCVQIWRGG